MTILDKIFATKVLEVEQLKVQFPTAELRDQVRDLPPCRGFIESIRVAYRSPALIAEIKRASPSQGMIRADFDPSAIARIYESTGATCLSVLTDREYFKGSNEDLQVVRAAVTLPILRKDFVIDPIQIYEARSLGADCILLIVRWLDASQLKEFFEVAELVGLDVLFEIHDEESLAKVLPLGPKMVGINNRDLSTFETHLDTSKRLMPQIPADIVKVSESALHQFSDIRFVQDAGADAVLIGTAFCQSDDVEFAVREVMGWQLG